MKLYSVSDCDPDPYEIFGWWEAVWATNEIEAIEWAKKNYGGEYSKEEIRVSSIMEENKRSKPEKLEVHRETRMSVLRDASWREEGESACDCCGLYAMGCEEYLVCNECYLCPECKISEREDTCGVCNG